MRRGTTRPWLAYLAWGAFMALVAGEFRLVPILLGIIGLHMLSNHIRRR